MPAPFAHGSTVTVWRSTLSVDRDNNPIRSAWAPAGDVVGCGVAPRESVEDNDLRSAVVIGVTLYAPAGADIRSGDRVELAGRMYEVDGDPADWTHPMTGWRPGAVVQLSAVEG